MLKSTFRFHPSDINRWKTTVIIPTGPAPVQCLKLAVFSLLLRSDVEKIDKIIVSINGPDKRSGDTKNQDEKEEFCLALARNGLPILPVRSWSRVGFAQPIDLALPLVATESYVIMHDDVIVLNGDWQKEVEQRFTEGAEAVVLPPVFTNRLKTSVYKTSEKEHTTITYLPCINLAFSAFLKSSNFHWTQQWCHIKNDAKVNLSSVNQFYLDRPKTYTILHDENFVKNTKKLTRFEMAKNNRSEVVVYDCGAWVTHDLISESGKIATFSKVAHHNESMSSKQVAEWETSHPDEVTTQFINELKESRFAYYYKHPFEEPVSLEGIRPLVCIVVYDRLYTAKHWINAWKKSNKYQGKLLIVQNVDDSEKCKSVKKEIEALEPDYHWIRRNDGESAKHWFELLNLKDVDFDWNVLVAFCDDCLPLRGDFLYPLLRTIAIENVGMTGGVMAHFDKDQTDYHLYMQRGICLAMKRDLLEAVKPMPYLAEKLGENFSVACELTIWKWAKEKGFSIAPTKHDWSLVYGWDCDNQGGNDLWEKADFNFNGGVSKIYELA